MARTSNRAYRPVVGEVVQDLAKRTPSGKSAEGVYMGSWGGKYYLRPEAGGCEWAANPNKVLALVEPRFVKVQHPSPPRTYGKSIGEAA
ncbi:hypothetical protein ACFXAF_00130 [Kitasatospora sp. NPDC059463]|uniref:hypothetical protein n=1 Tax=unclassified Kitasatospora TaxID=2633591 RepID=UPI0036CF3039